jgi:hypothetical protein
MSTITPIRVPVCNSDGMIVDRADPSRVRRLALAPNATVVRKRATGARRKAGERGEIVRILLASDGDESLEDSMRGNPRSYSNKNIAIDNPANVWRLKPIPSSTLDIFRAVTLDPAA